VGARPTWRTRLVRQYLLANPTASLAETVKATRASQRTVGRVRTELIHEGLIPVPHVGRPRSLRNTSPAAPLEQNVPGAAEEQIRKDVEAAISGGKILTRDERRVMLSAFANHPLVPHASRIAALRELEALEPPQSQQLGPGEPLTRADRVQRAALVLAALEDIDGKDAVTEALAQARADIDGPGPERPEIAPVDPPAVAPDGPAPLSHEPTEPGGALPDEL